MAQDSQKTCTESDHDDHCCHDHSKPAFAFEAMNFREQNSGSDCEGEIDLPCKDAQEPVSDKQLKGFDGIPREWFNFEKVFNDKTNRYSTTFQCQFQTCRKKFTKK